MAALVLAVVIISLSGCATEKGSENLTENLQPQVVEESPDTGDSTETEEHSAEDVSMAIDEFAVRLLKESIPGEKGVLVSPLSVLSALGMTANGAQDNTLLQMEAVTGLSQEEMNHWFYDYKKNLPNEEEYAVHLANSIWFRDSSDLTVQQKFLQTNIDYYEAAAFQTPFDKKTVEDINLWVSENTDHMIDKIVDEISEDSMLYLVNALSFEAEWEEIYLETAVRENIFTTEEGEERTVEFMYSHDHFSYLRDEKAQGFLRPYKGGRFAFMGLLPDEGVSVEDYMQELTGEGLKRMLDEAERKEVRTSIPKFETEYFVELSQILMAMGMTDAFDAECADFSAMGSYKDRKLYIDRVLHKTKITVDERGTKAGAATAVEMAAEAAEPVEIPPEVYLDRPFIYGIIDLETNTPLFLGMVTDL